MCDSGRDLGREVSSLESRQKRFGSAKTSEPQAPASAVRSSADVKAVLRRSRRLRTPSAAPSLAVGSRRPSQSSGSSSRTCSPVGTSSSRRRPARARRSPSASRSWSASTAGPAPTGSGAGSHARARRQIVDRARGPRRRQGPAGRRRLRRRRHHGAGRHGQSARTSSSPPRAASRISSSEGRSRSSGSEDARARRGRPHARHGVPPRDRPHRQRLPEGAADACSSPPRSTASRASWRAATPREAIVHEQSPPTSCRRRRWWSTDSSRSATSSGSRR